MITISLCMIVKDEAAVLQRCLNSVADLVDEINIVDTGSSDNTVEIASKYTERIFHYNWTGKFKDARNASFQYATKDYIFYLDADDVLLEEDRIKFKQLKASLNPKVDSVSMFYNVGSDEYGNITLRYRRNRLVKRSRNFKWQGDCHNYLLVSGEIISSTIAVTHKKEGHSSGRNLSIYKNKLKNKDIFTPRDYFYYGNELRENGYYQEAIESYTKNINMTDGWNEDKLHACIFRADCYRLVNDQENALASLFQSFQFSKIPCPEACSRVGYIFQKQREFYWAIFWYELALRTGIHSNEWSFTFPAYSTWYPHMQLCICYYNLQQFGKAYEHNELARSYRPNDELLLFHKELLQKKI